MNIISSFIAKHRRVYKKALRGTGISLLVPFRSDNGIRAEVFEWLMEYYKHELPGAEIIISDDDRQPDQPFCKTMAFNMAADRAKGDIFVLLDADCYIPGSVLISAATKIRSFEKRGVPLWFIPYRNFYRLNELLSADLVASNPKNPMRFHAKLDRSALDEVSGISHGHHYGALIQVMPRTAWETVGGMDIRFRGWGSEDVCFMKAVDTLYGPHKTIDTPVYHVWHPKLKAS
jgi:predicted glycosyltransferase involved in capsule biosynthesis